MLDEAVAMLRKKQIKIVRNCGTCRNYSPSDKFPYACKFIGHLNKEEQIALGTKDKDGNYNCPYWKDMFPNWFDRHKEFLFFVGSGVFTIVGTILGYLMGKT